MAGRVPGRMAVPHHTPAVDQGEIEDSILRELTHATGHILDNHVLIATLQDAKKKSVEVQQQLVRAHVSVWPAAARCSVTPTVLRAG